MTYHVFVVAQKTKQKKQMILSTYGTMNRGISVSNSSVHKETDGRAVQGACKRPIILIALIRKWWTVLHSVHKLFQKEKLKTLLSKKYAAFIEPMNRRRKKI